MRKIYARLLIGISLLFTSILITSCQKNDTPAPPPLPAITTVGANTFGTYIDEQVWLPRSAYVPGVSTLCVSYANKTLDISVYCDREVDDNFGNNFFQLHRSNITSAGTYDMSDPAYTSMVTVSEDLDQGTDSFQVISGKLTVSKLDVTNHVVSGQFDCVVKNTTADITHQVKSARFDLKIGYCK